MRNSLRIVAVGAALAAASLATSANAAATATATATAEVLNSLTLTADSALDFGQIAANGGGTVAVNYDNTKVTSSLSSGNPLVSTGTVAPAAFTVTGSANANVAVTLPTSASTLTWQGTWTGSGSAPTMSLDTFNGLSAVALNASGTGNFNVGGTLHVGANQYPGTYSGTFNVSVEYQ